MYKKYIICSKEINKESILKVATGLVYFASW